jgi:hypothetical protein
MPRWKEPGEEFMVSLIRHRLSIALHTTLLSSHPTTIGSFEVTPVFPSAPVCSAPSLVTFSPSLFSAIAFLARRGPVNTAQQAGLIQMGGGIHGLWSWRRGGRWRSEGGGPQGEQRLCFTGRRSWGCGAMCSMAKNLGTESTSGYDQSVRFIHVSVVLQSS